MLLSRALKYRICVVPRWQRSAWIFSITLMLMVSIWLWQTDWMVQQRLLQTLLSLVVLIQGGHVWRVQRTASICATVYEDGRWIFEPRLPSSSPPQALPIGEPIRLTRASKITSWVLCLHFRYAKSSRWYWVFRDELSDADYRRICLAIRYCQLHAV